MFVVIMSWVHVCGTVMCIFMKGGGGGCWGSVLELSCLPTCHQYLCVIASMATSMHTFITEFTFMSAQVKLHCLYAACDNEYTYTHIHTYMHTYIHIHTYTHTHMYTHTCTHTYTHNTHTTRTHTTRTHTTRTHTTYTHTHNTHTTHTHTHTHINSELPAKSPEEEKRHSKMHRDIMAAARRKGEEYIGVGGYRGECVQCRCVQG